MTGNPPGSRFFKSITQILERRRAERLSVEREAFPAHVRNAPTVRGPGSTPLLFKVVGQPLLRPRLEVEHVHLGCKGIQVRACLRVARERDLFPIGRPVRVIFDEVRSVRDVPRVLVVAVVVADADASPSLSPWQSSSRRALTFTTKMSLSYVAAPGSGNLIGHPGIVPGGRGAGGHTAFDAERWNAMYLPFGDQATELPRVSLVWSVPSAFIQYRSAWLTGSPAARFRLVSNTIRPFPSGDKAGKLLLPVGNIVDTGTRQLPRLERHAVLVRRAACRSRPRPSSRYRGCRGGYSRTRWSRPALFWSGGPRPRCGWSLCDTCCAGSTEGGCEHRRQERRSTGACSTWWLLYLLRGPTPARSPRPQALPAGERPSSTTYSAIGPSVAGRSAYLHLFRSSLISLCREGCWSRI